ncbi:3-phosphoshikimate 1-carboxyvinyltransferase [Nannocystis punicea]|uniref:3-phosphoshikimate 1-carboxyvinyltransferase n=1 Tax=Nannocystis punicea TaxID=2995304 RepID=A0ABY7H512_9BACT|nr:3-phosphoshikimate 1-carboxyvinyltransferase [Nannocystis poenicansa]WAS94365.1 3-phosphoshikimate 1-carboxyvinyltransferase [Nannocystis poenicansa]
MTSEVRVRPPPGPIVAALTPPGSKSLTNRALVLAAMSEGTSVLRGCLDSEDTQVMRAALARCGVVCEASEDASEVRVVGVGGPLPRVDDPERPIDVATAGTAARFLAAVFAASPIACVVDGSARMRERPMEGLLQALRAQGADIRCRGADDMLPCEIVGARLRGGEVRLARPPSSQFISALLLAAPLAEAPLRVVLEQGTPARPYVDMTLACLRDFGADARWVAQDVLEVSPTTLRGRDYHVEPDASAATYLLSLAAIYGGEVRVPGLGRTSQQGDARFCDVLGRMGANVLQGPEITLVRGTGALHGVDLDLSDMPDTTLTAAVLALHAAGPTRIRGVDVLRHHESDRIAAAATELRKLGAEVVEHDDGLDITPPAQIAEGAAIDTYRDHRVAMAFSLAGRVTIRDPGCVAKTFPKYFEVLAGLGMVE